MLLAGCADDGVIYDNTVNNPVSGNWQVSSSSGGVPLPRSPGALDNHQPGSTWVLPCGCDHRLLDGNGPDCGTRKSSKV